MGVAKVLVTGGCGFVGARVVQHLRQQHPECQITVLDTRSQPVHGDVVSGVQYLRADITSADEVRSVFANHHDEPFQAVVHCAGISPPLSERYARRIDDLVFRINVEGTRHVLEASRATGVKAFVFTSSITTVTDDFSQSYANIDERWPVVKRWKASSYGESKVGAERLVLEANTTSFQTCALRLAVVFGEGDYQLIPSVISCIVDKNESPYRLGDGMNLWDTVYVGNVADAHVLAVENLLSDSPKVAGEALFIHNHEPVSSRDFMLQIWKSYNGHIPPFEVGVPASLGWLIGLLGEIWTLLTGKPTTISRGSVADATAMRYTNGDKAKRLLGYTPSVGLEDGIQASCQVRLMTANLGRWT